MTTGMRIFLIVGSVLSCVYVLRRIRKSKMRTEDSVFWLFFSVVLVLLGIFPGIAGWLAGLLGVQSTVNLVYLIIIFLLLIRVFVQDQKVARTEAQLVHLIQTYAIDREEDAERDGIPPAGNRGTEEEQ